MSCWPTSSRRTSENASFFGMITVEAELDGGGWRLLRPMLRR
ncbi:MULTISPECIES: hypothetical protein [Streptosporangium]|uniref:Uncharacterized protein n=1 Tax=Streptosporangium brasiliense TaxID=47480 RepID=A0ABT9RHM2_9ACTN|nr:hypothetical protein [Streptosporangium brasiliense]MDP9868783.1 hypothetical protein [Streptosporangium brasiliense]